MDRPREPLPTRVEDTPPLPPAYDAALDAGLARARPDARPPAPAQRSTATPACCSPGPTAINLTAIRDPAAVALAHVVDSLSAVAVLRDRGVDRFVDLGSGGGYPGIPLAAALPAARALLLEPVGKKAALPVGRGDRATGLAGTVEAAAVRAEALAADARHRGRWPAVTARAVASLAELVELAFPLLAPGGILVAWKRGDARATSWPPRQRAIAALGGGSLEVRDGGRPGSRRPPAGRRHRARARRRPRIPRDPGDAQATAVVIGALLDWASVRIAVLSDIHSNLVALDAVLAAIGSVDAVWHLGDVVGYGPEPDGVVERLTTIGAVGVRGNHDAAAVGGNEIDWFNPDARAAMEWTRDAISTTTRAWLAALPDRRDGARRSRSSTAARATRSGSTSRRRRSPERRCRRSRPSTACTATPTCRSPSPRSTGGCGRSRRGPATPSRSARAGRSSTRAASASRATAIRGPATWSSTPTAGTATWGRVAYDIEAVRAAMRAAGLPRPARRPAAHRRLSPARDRRPPAPPGPQAGRPARPRRAPARPVLPLHRARPADRQGGRQRPDDAGRAGRSPRSAASSSAARWRARRSSASGCRRRRRSRSSARTRSARPPTRPRRSCGS